MKKYSWFDLIIIIIILISGIVGLQGALNQNYIQAFVSGVVAIFIGLLYGIALLIDKIEIYHQETRFLREDLAKLNKEISNAFDNVDTNFAALVHAIDDFVADLEVEEEE